MSQSQTSGTNRFHLFSQYRETSVGDWTPLRYATKEGWILGAWTWRKFRDHCEVGLFLCEDHQLYKRGSALNWSLRCILTQAFYQVGKMEIRFVGKPEGEATLESGFEPEVPKKIRDLATEYGIKLKHKERILNDEGRQIYLRLTGFDEELIQEFQQRGIDPIWPCVLVQRDIWTEQQIRFIFEHAASPDRIFIGGVDPAHRVSYVHDLVVLRLALMAGRLKTILEKFSGQEEGCTASHRWTGPAEVCFACDRDVEIPMLSGSTVKVQKGNEITALLLPRNVSEYRAHKSSDVTAGATVSFACVTRDYRSSSLPPAMAGRQIVALFDTLDDLDSEIELRLRQTMTSKTALAERHE